MKKKTKLNEWGYNLLTPIMRVLFKLWYNPTIVGKEYIPKEGSIIIASNHKHVYDQCLAIMATKRNIHYMAKKEYFEGKLAWFFKLVGCIPVDRGNKEDVSKDIAMEVLKNKGAIGIFPEGTRNKTYDKILLPLKYGAVSMSYNTDSYIVPCAVTGDYVFRSKNLMIRFGVPFKVENHDYAKYNDMLREDIESLMKDNLKDSNRTMEEELQSRNQDTKKK